MHSKLKGSCAELLVAADLMRQGYSVFGEYGDLSRADLIVETPVGLRRIQVKSCWSTYFVASLIKSSPGGKYRYSFEDFDIMALYHAKSGVICYLTKNDFGPSTSIRLTFQPTHPNGKGCHLAQDFTRLKLQ